MVRALQATEEAAATVAQRLAQAERLAPQVLRGAVAAVVREAQEVPQVAAARPTAVAEEAAASDVVVGRQPAAASAAVAQRREAAAVQGAAEVVQRRAVGPASVVVRLRVVAAVRGAAARQPEAEQDAAEPLPVVRGALAARLSAGGPSFRPPEPRPAPSARAQSAHARRDRRIAQP